MKKNSFIQLLGIGIISLTLSACGNNTTSQQNQSLNSIQNNLSSQNITPETQDTQTVFHHPNGERPSKHRR